MGLVLVRGVLKGRHKYFILIGLRDHKFWPFLLSKGNFLNLVAQPCNLAQLTNVSQKVLKLSLDRIIISKRNRNNANNYTHFIA